MDKRDCCFMFRDGLLCEAGASWQIWHGPSPEDYTEACTDHVGELLTDAPEHRVYPIID